MLKEIAQKEDIIDILRLIRSENVGIRTFYDLIKLHGTAFKSLEAIERFSYSNKNGKEIKIYTKSEALEEINKINNYGAKLITIFDDNYPGFLKNIYDPPPIITVFGDFNLFKKPAISIVGSRNASTNGCRIAYKFAREIGEEGFVTISGLARGIDTAVHKGSIKTGTIAVIAGGIDNIYPLENSDLYKEISEKGLVLSELPFGSVPKSQNFPQRNRIISGLSKGTLVIEATLKSGSLITAKYAIEQNREIFAIPGFPLDSRCFGTNKLIKDGAIMVTEIRDILDILNSNIIYQNKSNEMLFAKESKENDKFIVDCDISEIKNLLLEKLSYNPVCIEDLVVMLNFPYRGVITAIVELELSGKLLRYPGNKISLIFEDYK